MKAIVYSKYGSPNVLHLYGTLLSNVPDYNGSQILVDRIEVGG